MTDLANRALVSRSAMTGCGPLRTLVQGWWGYVSFFAKLFTLAMNAVAAVKIAKTPKPSLSSTPATSLAPAGWDAASWTKTTPDV